MHKTVLPKEEVSYLLPNFQMPFKSERPVYNELRLEPKLHLHRKTM